MLGMAERACRTPGGRHIGGSGS